MEHTNNSITVANSNSTSDFKTPLHNTGQINKLLTRLFPTANIVHTDNNCVVMNRNTLPQIMVQDKNCATNLTHDDITSFEQCLESYSSSSKCNGILISQNSGITSKPNFYIDFTSDGSIIVYIHHCDYSAEKLQIAVDIIDNIFSKLLSFQQNIPLHIPSNILLDINREYQDFIVRKENIISSLKETTRVVLSQLDDIRFATLNTYLANHFVETKVQKGFPCTQCNRFCGNNLKALAAHKRGCNRKMIKSKKSGIIINNNNENIPV